MRFLKNNRGIESTEGGLDHRSGGFSQLWCYRLLGQNIGSIVTDIAERI